MAYSTSGETFHFICKVEDTINDNRIVANPYCDVRTRRQAEIEFRRMPQVKKYLGNPRYRISFRENSVLIQDKE